jgi:hypothetical protein
MGSFPGLCTIGPASSRLGEGLANGLYSAHLALATPCGGPGACRLAPAASDTLVRLASELMVRSAVRWVMFQRTHDSTLASPEPVRELQ